MQLIFVIHISYLTHYVKKQNISVFNKTGFNIILFMYKKYPDKPYKCMSLGLH